MSPSAIFKPPTHVCIILFPKHQHNYKRSQMFAFLPSCVFNPLMTHWWTLFSPIQLPPFSLWRIASKANQIFLILEWVGVKYMRQTRMTSGKNKRKSPFFLIKVPIHNATLCRQIVQYWFWRSLQWSGQTRGVFKKIEKDCAVLFNFAWGFMYYSHS